MSDSDRRQDSRYDTSIPLELRFVADGTPIAGNSIEMSPNGMRVNTKIPLVEASYIHVSFISASNNTHCEGRVVWTQPSEDKTQYESGIDIQRWGGSLPGEQAIQAITSKKPKPDRRKKSR